MDNMDAIEAGWQVVDRTGDKIGTVETVGSNYLLISKGLIFPKDIYIPMSAVTGTERDEGLVELNIDKDQIDSMGWDEPPVEGGTSVGMGSDKAYGTDGAVGTSTATDDTYVTSGAGYVDDGSRVDDTARVAVHEEELRAQKIQERAGEVAVRKDVVEEQQTLDVPVTHEEVEVRRFTVDRPADSSEMGASGESITVPVSAERINVDKDVRVVEEIEISKRPVTETQRVTDTVRREQVNVEREGDVRIEGDR